MTITIPALVAPCVQCDRCQRITDTETGAAWLLAGDYHLCPDHMPAMSSAWDALAAAYVEAARHA